MLLFSVSHILNAIASKNHFKNDKDIATWLGLKPNALNNLKARNAVGKIIDHLHTQHGADILLDILSSARNEVEIAEDVGFKIYEELIKTFDAKNATASLKIFNFIANRKQKYLMVFEEMLKKIDGDTCNKDSFLNSIDSLSLYTKVLDSGEIKILKDFVQKLDDSEAEFICSNKAKIFEIIKANNSIMYKFDSYITNKLT